MGCSPYFEGFKKIPNPDDQEETYIAQDVLSRMDAKWKERFECLKNLHLLIKRYPQIGDLWALLVIAYLEGIETAPKTLPFSLETLPEIYIWGLILVFRALGEGNLKKASNLYSEMVVNAESEEELSH